MPSSWRGWRACCCRASSASTRRTFTAPWRRAVALLCGVGLDWLHGRIATLPRLAAHGPSVAAARSACCSLPAQSSRRATTSCAGPPCPTCSTPSTHRPVETRPTDVRPLRRAALHHLGGARHAGFCLAGATACLAQPVFSTGGTSSPQRGRDERPRALRRLSSTRTFARAAAAGGLSAASVDYELADAQGEVYARIYTRPAQVTPQRPPAIVRDQDAQEVATASAWPVTTCCWTRRER